MAKGFKHGAGGSNPLNFKVVGGTSAPSNPKENTIWVNTSTTITSYVFSATQPTGSAGMVWITTGTSSTVAFSATKKNPIMVYPISAKQYVNGSWVDKKAQSYQGGAWVDWITYLYKDGDTCDSITGGWSNIANSLWTFADDRVYGVTGNIVTNNKIDLTKFKKLFAEVICTNIPHPSQLFRFGITSSKTKILWDSTEPQVQLTQGSANKTIMELNVSAVSGSYHVGLSYNIGVTETGSATVYRVWGE